MVTVEDLIGSLLDLSKLEAKQMPLHLSHGDLNLFLREGAERFIPFAEERQIHYQIETQSEVWETDFDRDKLEKILSNLLSNAFKFR